ncbi:LAMI_0B06766g1_1 [Lachancea mirantina]|uniref:tRNA (guanine(9)-N1)-methyltransferase n=1 Tax=Lachancea mirantina TaxID=1230905 RepID=A0A1G4IWS0_9SACH|nr:LAMI_0B06766g1_1 [Lachancea mirantina]
MSLLKTIKTRTNPKNLIDLSMSEELSPPETPIRNFSGSPLPPVPEGMSKKQWKKICKRKRFEETKEKYYEVRREKKLKARLARRAKIQEFLDRGEEVPEELKRKPRKNLNQQDSGIKILIDCSFDDLMNDREIVSLSTQLTRAYSWNKRENYFADVKVTGFDKRLKVRFEKDLENSNFGEWKNFEFVENATLPTENAIYLTADADDTIEKLEPGVTYIVGGIVDKNRHKSLCYNKAKELGIRTRKLPISQFVNVHGRHVLTTAHVVQLMLKYFDHRDWKEAFESVLPQRKLEETTEGVLQGNPGDGSDQSGEEDKEQDSEEDIDDA